MNNNNKIQIHFTSFLCFSSQLHLCYHFVMALFAKLLPLMKIYFVPPCCLPFHNTQAVILFLIFNPCTVS